MNDSIVDEINKMTELISAQTAAPSTDSPVSGTPTPPTDPPGTPVPGTDPPGTPAPGTPVPGTEAPGTTAPSTEAPTDELEELRKQYNEMKEELEKLKNPPTDPPPTQAPSTDAPVSDEDFVGDLDLDELTRSKDDFNKILNAVMKKGVEIGRAESRQGDEQVLRSVPEMTRRNLEIITAITKASDEFYKSNEDLRPFKKVVAAVFEEKLAENPDKEYTKLMEDVGPEVRKRLDLAKKATKPDDKPPPLPKNKGGKRPNPQKPNTDPLLSEIDEMNKSLET